MEFKRTKLPAKANMVTCNEIMHFDDEELKNMEEEEINQPCHYGSQCPQEPFGNHTPDCEGEMKGLQYRNPGQTWRENALEQEEFNSNPEKYGGDSDQYGNRYNFRNDSDEEEAEDEGDDNK